MRVAAILALWMTVSACTTVRMFHREGCWVRRTETFPGQITEELGVCGRRAPTWSEDRLTRLVQECMVQADYRWQNRAVAAWTRGEPLPVPASEEEVLSACLNETATSAVAENEGLKSRVEELSAERESLRTSLEQQLAHSRANHDDTTRALAEAAKRPTPSAIATATSNGTATTQSDSVSQSPSQAMPAANWPTCVSAEPRRAFTAKPGGGKTTAKTSTSTSIDGDDCIPKQADGAATAGLGAVKEKTTPKKASPDEKVLEAPAPAPR